LVRNFTADLQGHRDCHNQRGNSRTRSLIISTAYGGKKMSNFSNNSNHGRVAKMCDYLDLIEKSASSNKASPDEVAALLAPIMQRLSEYSLTDAPVASTDADPADAPVGDLKSRVYPQGKPHPWVTIRECAESASLKDLSVAMAVFMNRYEEALGN